MLDLVAAADVIVEQALRRDQYTVWGEPGVLLGSIIAVINLEDQ